MSERDADSQAARILRHLRDGRPITPLQALRRFGCFRLGARIWDLRRAGWSIEREWDGDGKKRWAKYHLTRKRRRQA